MSYRDSDLDPNRTTRPPTLGFPTAREVMRQKIEMQEKEDGETAGRAENFLSNNKKVILENLVAFGVYEITKKQFLALFPRSNRHTEDIFFFTIRNILEPLGYCVTHYNFLSEADDDGSTLLQISLEEE